MSDMECPVCKTGNVEQGKYDKEYFCNNEFCPSYDETDTETYDILIRTRKALDVALCSLQDIAESNGDFITGASTPLDEHEYADMMLKEIKRQMKIETALEQKD